MTRFRTIAAVLLAATATVGLAACGDDSDSTTTSTTSTTASDSAEAAATARFDKEIQQELSDVGCYTGEIDGILGAESDAAILEFQKAAGLTADGELGPQTEDALKKAVDEGETVCSASTTTTTAATTTTGGGSGTAPCTATAIAKGLPDEGETITSYVCSEGYAAGSVSGDAKFLLVDDNGTWVAPSTDPCGSASAGIPPVILEDGCES